MTGQVVQLRLRSVPRAREIVAHPDLHDEGEVLDACETLIAHGDWMDKEHAVRVQGMIVREGVRRINRAGRRRAWCARALRALGWLIVVALAISIMVGPRSGPGF